jgi:hypothetical protein
MEPPACIRYVGLNQWLVVRNKSLTNIYIVTDGIISALIQNSEFCTALQMSIMQCETLDYLMAALHVVEDVYRLTVWPEMLQQAIRVSTSVGSPSEL